MLTMTRDDEAINRVRAIRATQLPPNAQSSRVTTPVAPTPEERLRRRVDLLETQLRDQRARAQRFEVALAEICTLTRRLTGRTTAQVHLLSVEALEIDEPDAPDTEPFE